MTLFMRFFKKKTLLILSAVAITLGYLTNNLSHAAPTLSPQKEIVKSTFVWFNSISRADNPASYTAKDVSLHFTDQAQMITNEKLVCTGIAEHLAHFQELNAHYTSMQADIDNMEMHELEDKIFLRYTIHVEDKNKQKLKIRIMGYMQIKDNKVNKFVEVIAKEYT